MKRILATLLATMCIFSLAGTAMAASYNLFTDVPAKHWAYAAVKKLANDGIVDGYNDQTFRGEKTITRYEMAEIVAKALAKEDKADANDRALINKLSTEFAQELYNLGVRVTTLENKVGDLENQVGNVKFSGEARMRFDNYNKHDSNSSANSQVYLNLWANAKISDNWVVKADIESTKDKNGTTSGTDDGINKIYATGSALGGALTFGKFNPFSAYGLVIDNSVDCGINVTGGQFEFGNAIKARLAYGNLSDGTFGNSVDGTNDFNIDNITGSKYSAAEVDIALSPVTNVKAAYHRVKLADGAVSSVALSDNTVSYYEGGFDTKFGSNFGLLATASKSDIDNTTQDNKAYLAQLQYKDAKINQPGSYDLFYNYRKVPAVAEINSAWDYSQGVKGNQIGFEYVPITNAKITAFYLKGNLVDDNSDYKAYRAQLEFFF